MKNLFNIPSTEKLKSFFQKVMAGLTVTGIVWWFQMIFPINFFSKFKTWVSWLAIIITGFVVTFLLYKIRNKGILNVPFIALFIRWIRKYYKFFIVPLLLFAFYFGLKSYVHFTLSKEINTRMDIYEEDLNFIYNTIFPCYCEFAKEQKLRESHETRGKLDTLSYDELYHTNLLIKRVHNIVSKASPNNHESAQLVKGFNKFYTSHEVYKHRHSEGEISKEDFFKRLEDNVSVNISSSLERYIENVFEPVVVSSLTSIKGKFWDSDIAFKTFLFIETKLKDWNDNGHFKDKMDDRRIKILTSYAISAIKKRGKNYEEFKIYLRNDCIPSTLKLLDK